MKLEQYFNEEVKQFSLYDCERSIADYRDGLKTVQRKILYGITEGYGENKESLQVSRLVGLITSFSGYHHGEISCEKAVVGMAQNFPGANNIPLLVDDGQFGNMLDNTPGASRYIRTKLSENTRKFFLKEDNIVLNYKISEDDGTKIEPEVYYPILPFVLINGNEGIGTGFAMRVLSYNPIEIKEQINNLIANKKAKVLLPWYKGFTGKIEKMEKEGGEISIAIKGVIIKESLTTLRITQLPIGMFWENYKEFLNKLEDEGVIKDYEDNSTEKQFDFLIRTTKDITSLPEEKLLEKFKLIKREKENLTFWKSSTQLKKFKNNAELLTDWVKWRLSIYELRRKKKIELLKKELEFQLNVSYFKENLYMQYNLILLLTSFFDKEELRNFKIGGTPIKDLYKVNSNFTSASKAMFEYFELTDEPESIEQEQFNEQQNESNGN